MHIYKYLVKVIELPMSKMYKRGNSMYITAEGKDREPSAFRR